jgi:hypothetical protein
VHPEADALHAPVDDGLEALRLSQGR